MATLRAALLIFLWSAAAAAREPAFPQPTFPILIRLDEEALEPLRTADVQHHCAVDHMVLGTRARGTCWTDGKLTLQLAPEGDDAVFTVHFHGNCQTRTTGVNGPALIRSRTLTQFSCTRDIVFDAQQGFVCKPTTIQAKTTLQYEGFGAVRRGLGRRLVARVAERRAMNSRFAAQAIAQRDNQAAIVQAFEQRLDDHLATINQRLAVLRDLKTVLVSDRRSRVSARSCEGGLLIGIGDEENARGAVVELPARKQSSPIEVWLHFSLGGEGVTRLASALQGWEPRMPPGMQQYQVVLKMLESDKSPAPVKFDYYDGWLIIGISGNSPDPSTLALWTAVDVAERLPRVPTPSPPASLPIPRLARIPAANSR